MNAPSFDTVLEIFKPVRFPRVFPAYIAMRINEAMRAILPIPNRDFPGADTGEMKAIGDCKYAIPITDKNGIRYRVTVEVLNDAERDARVGGVV